MGIFDKKEKKQEKEAEKRDAILIGIDNLNKSIEKLQKQQEALVSEIVSIAKQNRDIKTLSNLNGELVKFDFYLYLRKKRGYFKVKVNPKHVSAFLNIMKEESNGISQYNAGVPQDKKPGSQG